MCWQNTSLKDLSFDPDLEPRPHSSSRGPHPLWCVWQRKCSVSALRALFLHVRARRYLSNDLFTGHLRQQRREPEKRRRAQSSVPWIGAAGPPLRFHLFPSFLERWLDESSHNSDASRTFLRRSYRGSVIADTPPFVLGLGEASAPLSNNKH